VRNQQRDVVEALAESGHLNGDDAETIVQVLAKSAALDFVAERFVCGGKYANIDGNALRFSTLRI
jgi:hypothetical protein